LVVCTIIIIKKKKKKGGVWFKFCQNFGLEKGKERMDGRIIKGEVGSNV
jgi:hypothetical protein